MELSHVDANGKAQMVDVGEKKITHRKAVAESRVALPENVRSLFDGTELHMAKGPVFQTAIIAGIMGAKKTADLIPMCHPLGLDHVDITCELVQSEVVIRCTASCTGKTGVEMEALTGASIAALTVYDMCKALSHDIIIRETKLIEKKGGKRDFIRTT